MSSKKGKLLKSINDYINEYKKSLSIKTDTELAKRLKVGRSQIYKIKKGNSQAIGKEKYLDIAKELKINPLIMIATLEAEKEKDEEIREIWIKIIKEKSENPD